ncbi:FUSC family protein [Actinokineospora diospyrosa]|uniref:Uncharacterized protein n=1 Tax=Actinokineospora diospyrosa TaxID=103728 RepID=A0ABT1IEH6_9PSEU|nr:FUSC family protein [Actinokineospora diospyrosa]MCP2271034.1 hypothetical protein [Actinokineospora diospyrosa]
MARSSSDTGLQEAFTAAGLTRRQRSLLQTVLRALDNGSGPGFHAATSDSALVALIRAHDALSNHAAHGHPHGRLLLRVLRTSAACVRTALPILPSLRTAITELDTMAEALRDTDPAEHQVLTRASATALEPVITSATDAITDHLLALWDATVSPNHDAKAAAEIAVSVYLRGRDREALRKDLATLLTGTPTAADLAAVLWPPPRRHHVTVLVSGARTLDHLDVLLPGSRQWPVTVDQDGWPKARELAALLARLAPITRAGTLVRVPVDATDLGTAVVLGRRAISEALDQYVAGNRIADLVLAGPWAVAGPDERWVLGEPARASVRRTAPLSPSWSDGLRPALRLAHIAQRVEAPMTSAALCWSALESIGLAEKSARLARAYALQTLRHQVMDAHAQLRLTVTEEVRRLGSRVSNAQVDLRRAENALAKRALLQRTTPADAKALAESVTRTRQSYLDHVAAHQHALDETTTLMALIDAHVPRTTDKPTLTEPDRWVDLLLPARDGDPLAAARDAVTTLSTFAGGLTHETILLWRERLARPQLLAKWLQEKQDTCHALLEWLYTTRNITFHHGQFAGPVDLATAHAGRAIIDMLLEILGRWHSTQHARGQNPTPPSEILKVLSHRKDALNLTLLAATSCHPLSIQHLTGPDEVYWSATR